MQTNHGTNWRNSGGPDVAGPRFRGEATDPWLRPDLYRGALTRRVFAFCVDVVILAIPVTIASLFIAIFGVVTLGLGWMLFWLISPASAIWAVVYYGASLGGPHQATVGMRLLGVQMRTLSGAPGGFILGASHAILYWLSVSLLTPFVLLFPLFSSRRQLLHDFVLGTVVVNDRD